MKVCSALVTAVVLSLAMQSGTSFGTELRQAVDRPGTIDVGDPITISRRVLAREMQRNVGLRDWVDLYGPPDYAEVQRIQIEEPFAPYEVRLYYIDGNRYLAFGRVHVASSVYDYGLRKYVGPIDPAELERLLTAKSAQPEPPAAVEPVEVEPESALGVTTVAVEAESEGTLEADAVEAEVVEVEAVEVEVLEVDGVEGEVGEETEGEGPQVAVDRQVMGAVLRLEAAAQRAALAAGVAERASRVAVESADRATLSVERVARIHAQQ